MNDTARCCPLTPLAVDAHADAGAAGAGAGTVTTSHGRRRAAASHGSSSALGLGCNRERSLLFRARALLRSRQPGSLHGPRGAAATRMRNGIGSTKRRGFPRGGGGTRGRSGRIRQRQPAPARSRHRVGTRRRGPRAHGPLQRQVSHHRVARLVPGGSRRWRAADLRSGGGRDNMRRVAALRRPRARAPPAATTARLQRLCRVLATAAGVQQRRGNLGRRVRLREVEGRVQRRGCAASAGLQDLVGRHNCRHLLVRRHVPPRGRLLAHGAGGHVSEPLLDAVLAERVPALELHRVDHEADAERALQMLPEGDYAAREPIHARRGRVHADEPCIEKRKNGRKDET
jgi:hypothetical protein